MATGAHHDALEDGEVRSDGSGDEGCGTQAHAGELGGSATPVPHGLGADPAFAEEAPCHPAPRCRFAVSSYTVGSLACLVVEALVSHEGSLLSGCPVVSTLSPPVAHSIWPMGALSTFQDCLRSVNGVN